MQNMQYLRVSLLKACNFNCFYCKPPPYNSMTQRDFTRPDKFKSAIELVGRLGINKIRFTGGEPTLYNGLNELISFTKTMDGNIKTALTSNGLLLKKMAPALAKAGLDSINISLDSVDAKKFSSITGARCFEKVVSGIKAAIEFIPEVKLNCVVIRDVNDDEVDAMVSFANDLGIDIRLIEYMPTKYNSLTDRGYIPGEETMGKINHKFYPVATEKSSPARYYASGTLGIKVGFINSVSRPFCVHCNRIRLTSDGNLFTCLFTARKINLFELLDQGRDSALRQIDRFVAGKQFGSSLTPLNNEQFLPSFSEIGG